MGNIKIARLFGIPLLINISWFLTLAFITSYLAVRLYPDVLPADSAYRNDAVAHWGMAIGSGLIFFASIVLHELAHSLVARQQGLPVKNITLFVFGGVSQIGGEARRPLHEFIMAVMGPLTSLLLAGAFFGLWWLQGSSVRQPVAVVCEWLFYMNLVVAVFNMAPGFPMDGGRVLRALIWGVSGNFYRATRLATFVGRGLGYALIGTGILAFVGALRFVDPWSGLWFAVLGLFLESSARQAWIQTRAMNMLSGYRAQEIMSSDLDTMYTAARLPSLLTGDDRHFIYFVADEDDKVVGVLTEKELGQAGETGRLAATVGDVMTPTGEVPVAKPDDTAAEMLESMESASVWHLPVIGDGRVIGVVSKDSLFKLISHSLFPERMLRRQR